MSNAIPALFVETFTLCHTTPVCDQNPGGGHAFETPQPR
jgi:hypothetical protein